MIESRSTSLAINRTCPDSTSSIFPHCKRVELLSSNAKQDIFHSTLIHFTIPTMHLNHLLLGTPLVASTTLACAHFTMIWDYANSNHPSVDFSDNNVDTCPSPSWNPWDVHQVTCLVTSKSYATTVSISIPTGTKAAATVSYGYNDTSFSTSFVFNAMPVATGTVSSTVPVWKCSNILTTGTTTKTMLPWFEGMPGQTKTYPLTTCSPTITTSSVEIWYTTTWEAPKLWCEGA